jgi:2-polyprenyl-6-methoxyphenol hydroxylase-like FAD-dependent oxidoreductase
MTDHHDHDHHDYDAIVVGARCAGAPTAMLLARLGYRVLAVDRAIFPSDTLSTLLVQPHGIAALARWGLLDDVRATGCPTIDSFTFDFGPIVLSGSPRPADGYGFGIAPRRTVLDALLVDAARQAGAEVREGYRVDRIVVDNGRVTGIEGRNEDGSPGAATARVVIGADGWNSAVARAVGAPEYRRKPVLENAFYTFWRGLPVDGMRTVIRGDRGIALIPTHDDATLLLVGCPFDQATEFRSDVEANYFAALEREPLVAEAVRAAERVERFAGGGVPNTFRVPFGPGWALVGDAGYVRDPITAQGICNAFESAEWCTAALDQVWSGDRPWDAAFAAYQARRDADYLELYEFTTQLATLEPPPPPVLQALAVAAQTQEGQDDFVSVNAGTLAPSAFFDAVAA